MYFAVEVKQCSFHRNYDLTTVITPIDAERFYNMLVTAGFPREDAHFLYNGFTHGFDLGYEGPLRRMDRSKNLPFTVGNKYDLWEKLMKEVDLRRFAGPFEEIPFRYYVQSPVGLVPKGKGNQTRLIFHLSYDFERYKSINHYTPDHMCKVKYNDLDFAIKACLYWCKRTGIDQLFYGSVDFRSAFRILPTSRKYWPLMLIMAKHPVTGRTYFFADKCLAFGHGISCALFQKFSNAVKYLIEYITGCSWSVTNYLDDFLFISIDEFTCNNMVRAFYGLCHDIGLPIAEDKTVWATQHIVFLGILLLGDRLLLAVPEEKRVKALNMLNWFLGKRKAKVLQIQRLTGLLNFLNKAIYPNVCKNLSAR